MMMVMTTMMTIIIIECDIKKEKKYFTNMNTAATTIKEHPHKSKGNSIYFEE